MVDVDRDGKNNEDRSKSECMGLGKLALVSTKMPQPSETPRICKIFILERSCEKKNQSFPILSYPKASLELFSVFKIIY